MENPIPAPEVTPAAPVTPEPATPVTPPAAPVVDTDDQEWDDVIGDTYGIKKDDTGDDDEQSKPEEEPKKEPAPQPNPDDQKPDEESGDGDDAKKTGEEEPAAPKDEPAQDPNAAVRDARIAQREAQQQLESTKADVKAQMFADTPTELRDADGDPINSIEDVMKLVNPRTGEGFTEEEAGMWLLSAQQQFNKNLETIEKQAEQIAQVNVDLKDQADSVRYQYGELLKSMPDVRDKVWEKYQKTLVKDPTSGIIISAPVSMTEFYETMLTPYAELAAQKEAQAAATAAQQQADAARRSQSRTDRSDIYAPGNKNDIMDDEEKEWADAAKAVFG